MSSKNIIQQFGDLPDPREDNRRHLLIDILMIVVCASICGAEKWIDIEAFGKAREGWLRRFLQLPHGIPSHDTFARVFAMLDPKAFNERFSAWVAALQERQREEIITIDGKTVRRSGDNVKGKLPIHVVSAWANKAGLTLGQVKVDEKSNEITAIPELLEMLEVEGCVVTIDAMGTQTKIAEKIIERGADYLLALKGNQGTLQADVALYFEGVEAQRKASAQIDYHTTVDKDHGRIETRHYWATGDIDWLQSAEKWRGLKSLCMVKAQRLIGDKQTEDTRYYISSLPPQAKRLGETIRAHWGIENSLHWVLDIAFREDECRKRRDHSAENFALLRHITLNLLKQEKTSKRSIAGKRLIAAWDEHYMERVLFNS